MLLIITELSITAWTSNCYNLSYCFIFKQGLIKKFKPLKGNDSVSLVGPIHFESVNEANRVRQRVSTPNWYFLLEMCTIFGISPPTLGVLKPPASRHIKTQAKHLKRKRA